MVAVGDGGQGFAHVGEGLDAVDLAGFDQRCDARPCAAALVMAGEESVLAIEGHCPFILPMSGRNGKSIIAGTLILA